MDDWRKAWAKRSEDLDILVSSAFPDIRICVATIGRPSDLDKLAYDKEPIVRAAVADQGRDKDLDRLVNDPNEDVWLAVLKQGRDKDLDQLVSDDDCYVRRIAARQLPNSMSASEAQEALAKAGLSISQAVQAAMTKVDQAKLAYDIAAPNGDPNAPQLKQRLDAAKQDLAQETISAIETLNDKTLGKPLGDDELPF